VDEPIAAEAAAPAASAPSVEAPVAMASAAVTQPRSGLAPGPFGNTPNYLLDVKLTVSAEVGRVQIPVREIMDFGPGSLIELQRSAADPVEIFANGRCIGRGEIVVIGDQFGVRVTELGAAA